MIPGKLDIEEWQDWFSSVNMTYANGHVPLLEITKKHCNFLMVGGKSTGYYRFTTGY